MMRTPELASVDVKFSPLKLFSASFSPPIIGSCSTKMTSNFLSAASCAAAMPAGPEPTTTTSQKSFACSYLSGSGNREATPMPAALRINFSYNIQILVPLPHSNGGIPMNVL